MENFSYYRPTKPEQAVALLEPQVAALRTGKTDEVHGALAYAYARAGRAREARAMLQEMRTRSGGRLPATGAVAAALDALGDREAAVAVFTAAVAGHDVWLVQFPRMTRYESLRTDPRVSTLLDRLGSR